MGIIEGPGYIIESNKIHTYRLSPVIQHTRSVNQSNVLVKVTNIEMMKS